jgi:hypothetical protein
MTRWSAGGFGESRCSSIHHGGGLTVIRAETLEGSATGKPRGRAKKKAVDPRIRPIGTLRERPSERRVMLLLALVVLCVGLTIQTGRIASSDGTSMYEVARSIVDKGEVAIERGVVWQGRDGRYYSPFGIGLSLLALVPYGGIALLRHVHPVPDVAAEAAVAALMPLIVALLAAATYELARLLGASIRTGLLVALGTVGGTLILVYSKDFFTEPVVALFLVVSVALALVGRPAGSSAALAAAAITRPQFLLLAPVWLWRIQRDAGWSAVYRSVPPFAAAVVVDVVYNVIRFGDPLNFGYSTPELRQGFTTPILQGAAGLLFDPQKSVLLFAPVTLLVPFGIVRLRRAAPTAFWLLGANLVVTFVLSATWWAWGGGWVWGPRLLIPAVIPAAASVGAWADSRRWRVVALTGLIAFGVLVNVPGAIVSVGAQLSDDPAPSEGPQVVRQYELMPQAVAYTAEHLYDRTAADGGRYLSFWQVLAAREWDRPGFAGAMLATAALLGAAALLARLLAREVRRLAVEPPRIAASAPTAAQSERTPSGSF